MKGFLLAGMIALLSSQQVQEPQQRPKNPGFIAHVERNGVSFSIQIDPSEASFLSILVPERTGAFTDSTRPAVRLKVVMANDAVVEGPANLNHGFVSMGGWNNVTYRFALKKRTTLNDINYVTIWIGDESFTVFPY